MANAYATIASGGMRNRPTAITRVTFPDGRKELPARWKVRRTRAFEDGVTAKATEILEQNMQSGTGTKAQIGCPAAGKTGTTDEFTDAWFVGFTPRLSTAVWVGYPNDRTQMLGLYYGANVAGGTFPAEIWNSYMTKAKGKFCGDFPPPKTPFSAQPFFGKYTAARRQGQPDRGRRRGRPVGRGHAGRRRDARARRRGHAGARRARRRRQRQRQRQRERQRQRLRSREVRGPAAAPAAGDDGGGTQAPG